MPRDDNVGDYLGLIAVSKGANQEQADCLAEFKTADMTESDLPKEDGFAERPNCVFLAQDAVKYMLTDYRNYFFFCVSNAPW